MKVSTLGICFMACPILAALNLPVVSAAETPGDDVAPRYFIPQLLGAQYTGIDQHQYSLRSPYEGKLSLRPQGDTERSHTFGTYLGMQLPWDLQLYGDIEKFDGEGVSGSTGMGGLPNGDVIRSGTATLKKRPYFARHFVRYSLPIGEGTHDVERAVDQLPGKEADRRIDFKAGKMAVSDDFDKNRYSNSTRTQFMNWSLWNNSAWDFAADTRGYTNGVVVAYVDNGWSLRYGLYQMPRFANGQTLDSIHDSAAHNMELTLQPGKDSWAVRILGYYNVARMGIYRQAIDAALREGGVPNIVADDRIGRHKLGFGLNGELPLADDGETGLFARYGWNDGATESFAFTEVDRNLQIGGQLSGKRWQRPEDHVSVALAVDGLSKDHADYLEAGGSGFVLGDGRLHYGTERIIEAYYSWQVISHVTLSPDLQFVRDPGYNRDRGPARFASVRLHFEY
jgi:high affinity Mn2+ porin